MTASRRFWISIFIFLQVSHSVSTQHLPSFPLNQEKLIYAQDVEAKAIVSGDPSLMAEAHYLYGKVYARAGDYLSSQKHFLYSLRIQEELRDTLKIARLYVRLGENENSEKHYPEAMDYVRKAATYARKLKDYKRLVAAYHAVGLIYESIWESDSTRHGFLYDSSLHYYHAVYEIVKEENDLVGIAEALFFLGKLKQKNGDRESISLLNESVRLLGNQAQLFTGVEAGAYLAMAYLNFDDLENGRKWLMKTEKYHNENAVNDFETYILLLSGWKRYYQKSGNLLRALTYSEMIREVEKKQFLADRSQTLVKLNQELNAEKTEEELSLQRNRAELLTKNYQLQQNISRLLIGAVAASLVGGFLFYRLYRKVLKVSRQNEKLVVEQSHRLKNQLQMAANLLSLQSGKVNQENALDAIQKSRLRLQAIALLQKRLDVVDPAVRARYIDLSPYCAELAELVLDACGYENIDTQFSLQPFAVKTEVALPLGLILNELITNSCKYAFPGHPSPKLSVTCFTAERRVYLTVSDNGPSIAEEIVRGDQSFGIQLIRIQAEQLNARHEFTKDLETGGMTFRMDFPV